MAAFLVKSDPDTYGLADLERDGRTRWDGVKNPVAQKHLRSIARGDDVLVYHSGAEKAVVGLARAASAPYADPGDPAGKLYVVDLQFVSRVRTPLALKEIRADPATAQMELCRMPRLSVMPVAPAALAAIRRHTGL
ncbi:MAG: EVE domain-containing protein [Deltaproteobacteria bacterium]|nr:EVE domain-containing protein [Deltaproteobacteria bacterium]